MEGFMVVMTSKARSYLHCRHRGKAPRPKNSVSTDKKLDISGHIKGSKVMLPTLHCVCPPPALGGGGKEQGSPALPPSMT